jgi:hypothetical protein
MKHLGTDKNVMILSHKTGASWYKVLTSGIRVLGTDHLTFFYVGHVAKM